MAYFNIDSVKVDKLNAPLLVVGLGGTGADGVRHVKHELNKRLNPDMVDGLPLDRPPRTAYLAVDCDAGEVNKRYQGTKIDKITEWFDLSEAASMEFLLANNGKNLTPSERHWFDEKLFARNIVTAAFNGAGTFRQLSRLMLFTNANALVIKLQGILANLITVSRSGEAGTKKIKVVVIAGISGGTGSGAFLDFAYLLKEAAKKASIEIMTEFFVIMPDVTIADHALTDQNKQVIYKTNGFAALKELDYWMSVETRKNGKIDAEDYSVQYAPHLIVPWNEAPYDDVTLLCAKDISGKVFDGAYEVAMEAICESLLLQMSDERNKAQVVVGADNSAQTDVYSYMSQRSNEEAYKLNLSRPYPQNYCYRAIGTYSKESEQTNKVNLEARLVFDDLNLHIDMPEHEPNMQSTEPDAFMANFEALFTSFRDTFDATTGWDPQKFKKRYSALKTLALEVAPHMDVDTWNTDVQNAIDENRRSFASQLRQKFENVAGAYIREKGPKALKKMLNDPFNGFVKRLKDKKNEYGTNKNTAESSFASAKTTATAKFTELKQLSAVKAVLKGEDAAKAYNSQAESVYSSKQEELFNGIMESILGDFVKSVKEQVLERNIEYVLKAIEEVSLELNKQYDKGRAAAGDKFHSIEDQIKALYSDAANKQRLFDSAISCITDACLAFDDSNAAADAQAAAENLISKVNSVMATVYTQVNTASIQRDLAAAGISTPAQISAYIQQTLAPEIERGAAPYFALTASYGILSSKDAVLATYISVPANETAVRQGVQNYLTGRQDSYSGCQIKDGAIPDRIFWTNVVAGLPLCAYEWLPEYETIYEQNKNKRPGVHLVMNNDVNTETHNIANDWDKLPSPLPAREFYDMRNAEPAIVEKLEEAEQCVKDAVNAGVIVIDTNGMPANFSAIVRLTDNAEAKLQEIRSSTRNYEGKIADIDEYLNQGAAISFNPINDQDTQNDKLIKFSSALEVNKAFNDDKDVQIKCFVALVVHELSRRPAMLERLKTECAVRNEFIKQKETYIYEVERIRRLKASYVEIARMWVYDFIRFETAAVVYKNREGAWKNDDGKVNAMVANAELVGKKPGDASVPLALRLPGWYVDRPKDKAPIKMLLDMTTKLHDAMISVDRDPEKSAVYKARCEEIIETLKKYAVKIDDIESEDIISKAYADEMNDALKAIRNEVKQLKDML